MKPCSMLLATCLALLAAAACTTIGPTDPHDQAVLDQQARSVIADTLSADPEFAEVLNRSRAWAVFPQVGRAAVGLSVAYGTGAFYRRGQLAGFCDLSQSSLGLSLGGQACTVIICLLSTDAVVRFERGIYRLNAQATAVALTYGSSVQGRYADDVRVFILDETGLMFEASFGVQQFRLEPLWTPKAH